MKDLNRSHFHTINNMGRIIKDNINAVVTPTDILYIIGDLSWLKSEHKHTLGKYLEKVNGTKHLILGNHDYMNAFDYEEIGVTSIHTSLIVNNRILCHDPAKSCVDRTKTWIVGHVHTLFKICRNCINVGVDVWDFKPVSETEVENMEKSLSL